MYIYTRTRTRKGFGLGRAFLFAGKFRKQNKVGSDTLTSLENKTRSVMFRKQNNGRDEKTGQRVFSRSLSEKRQTVAGCPTHARALAPFFLFLLSYKKKLFFSFFSFFYIFSFFLFVFFCKS